MIGQRIGCAEPDDAGVVDHLRHDHHVVRRLDDRVIVVVERIGEHRGANVFKEHEATLGQRAKLGMIGALELAPELSALLLQPLRL